MLSGVRLVIVDHHEGTKAAASKVLSATPQPCRMHFMSMPSRTPTRRSGAQGSAAMHRPFVQGTRADAARTQWRSMMPIVRLLA